MQPWDMISDSVGVDRLLKNIDGTLSKLEAYLEENAGPKNRLVIEGHIKDMLRVIINEGQVRETSPEYEAINRFYEKFLGERAPFYVADDVNVRRREITSFEFTPDSTGEFTIRSEEHGFKGTLVVEEGS